MRIPFTIDQFFEVFAGYNDAIWPLQWLLLALGAGTVVLSLLKPAAASRGVSVLLGVLWLWTGTVYHLLFFRAINPAATAFGAFFIVEGILFLWLGAYRRRLVIAALAGWRRILGTVLVLYALVVYPVLGYLLGHRYPAAPTLGAPCPTTILTLGLLVWAVPAVPPILLLVPVVWALIATSVVWQFGMLEDLGLPVAAIIAVAATLASRSARSRIGQTGHPARIAVEPTEAT